MSTQKNKQVIYWIRYLILLLAAVALNANIFSSKAMAQGAAIRIGVAYPLTGPIATNGISSRDGAILAFEEERNQIAGRKIELLIEDTQGRPDIALTKVKAMVERDRADILVSILASTAAAAVAPYIKEAKIPWVTTGSLVALTRDLRSPYTFRMTPSSYEYGLVAANWAKQQGWKKAYYLGWNAAPAREAFDAVKSVLGSQSITDALFPNIGTPDYAPYLTKLDPSKADGAFVSIWAADAPRIARQFAEYGLRGKLPFFGVASFTAEEGLADMPPEVEGVHSGYVYCGTLNTPENRQFVESYRNRFKSIPGPYPYQSYMAAKAVIQALKDVNGRIEDKEAFLTALRKVQLKGPMGIVSFDERQGMITDFQILRVVRKDGRLQNECVGRIASRDPYNLFP